MKLSYILIAVLVLAITVLTYLNLSSSQTAETYYEAKIIDGKQYVDLTWGKVTYSPDNIKVKAGMPIVLTADLSRITGCYRAFVIPSLNLDKYFSEGDNTVEFIFPTAGRYKFTCRMGMGNGLFIVD